MAFWITIGISLIVALIYSRRGLYEALILAFNLTLAVYLALYLAPTLVSRVPSATDIPGGLSLAILLLFALGFGILCAVSFFQFTGQYSVPLPKVLDWLGGGITGFVAGFLGTSFLAFIVTLTPIPGVPDFARNMEVTPNIQMVSAACDTLHHWVGADRRYKAKDLLVWLNEKAKETRPDLIVDPNSDPNKAPTN
jgi:hypothetical protein